MSSFGRPFTIFTILRFTLMTPRKMSRGVAGAAHGLDGVAVGVIDEVAALPGVRVVAIHRDALAPHHPFDGGPAIPCYAARSVAALGRFRPSRLRRLDVVHGLLRLAGGTEVSTPTELSPEVPK